MSLEHPNRLAALLKNGVGTIVTRLLILAMPFIFAGSIWAGKLIIQLEGEKILSAIERIDHRVDRISDYAMKSEGRIGALESGQASQEAKLEGIRDRLDDGRRARR